MSAKWYYKNAQLVDDIDLNSKPWTGEKRISFDGTKDKRGERHTTMKIVVSEKEIEHLYNWLQQGRKNELRDAHKEVTGLDRKLDRTFDKIEKCEPSLKESWMRSPSGSDEEAIYEKLRTRVRAVLDSNYDP